MQTRNLLFCITMALSLSHCASYDFSRRVVQQGNLLSPNKIARLKVGMSKEDVAILMGTSLFSPLFNNDRWDYAFTRRKGMGPMIKKNLTLYFHNGSLARIEEHRL